MKKKISDKESWCKNDEKDDDEEDDIPTKIIKLDEKVPVRKLRKIKTTKKTSKENAKTMIFVPHTVGSGLAKELRKKKKN